MKLKLIKAITVRIRAKKLEDKKITLSKEAFEKEIKNFEKKVDDLKTYIDRKQNSLKKLQLTP